jgi:preprotein translocase subunit SecD
MELNMMKSGYCKFIASAILLVFTMSACTADTKRLPNGKPVSFKLVKDVREADSSSMKNSDSTDLESEVLLSEKDIAEVYAENDGYGRPSMIIKFTADGSKKLADVTEKFRGRNMAIVFENKIILSARIIESIGIGSLRVSGSFTQKEIDDMVKKIRGSN